MLKKISLLTLVSCALCFSACKKPADKAVDKKENKEKKVAKAENKKAPAKTEPKRPPRPTELKKRPEQPIELSGAHILIAYKGARRANPKIKRSKDDALKLAKKVTAMAMKAPKKFAELAKKYSDGPSGKMGGSLGVWRKGRMVPAFDKAIIAMKEGEISKEPVETAFGYHVMIRNPLKGYVSGAHILVAYKGARRAKPAVTRTKDEAKKLAAKYAAELKKDPKKFDEMVAKVSDGPAAKHGGKLGTWREGQTNPVFDKALSGVKVGEIAGPAETPFGFHVFMRKPIPPEYAGSHILIAYKGATRAAPYITRSKEEAKKLATELAEKAAKDPKSFEKLALQNSDGPTAQFGGDLGVWRKGRMAKEFDQAIESLKDGEVTPKSVETPFGFHVIRRNALPTAEKN